MADQNVEWQLYAELCRGLLAETSVDIALPSKTECICHSLLLKEMGTKETPKTSRTSRTFHANMSEGAVLFFGAGQVLGPRRFQSRRKRLIVSL